MSKILYKTTYEPFQSFSTHLICWCIFITYEVIVSGIISNRYDHFVNYFLFYILNISLFYFHAHVILKKTSKRILINIWRIPTLIALELLMHIGISILIVLLLLAITGKQVNFNFVNQRYIISVIYRGVYFILYGTAYYMGINYLKKKEFELKQSIENEKLKNELLIAEQDFLRAQINPHLLFNTLSFIKYAAKTNAAEASEAIMRLSGIMSYALENNACTAPLKKEIDQIENIIRLNQLRYNHTLHINYTKNIHDPDTPIIPIVLLTLIENIFKHGDLLNPLYPAEIKIETNSKYLIVSTSNLPNGSRPLRSSQAGLPNIHSRLENYYKKDYRFSYGLEGEVYKVYLKIAYKAS